MKVYLAGPMSWHPQMNFPIFDAAATEMRFRGIEVVSPAELDSPEARAAALASPDGNPKDYADGDTWGSLLARDVKLIADEGIEAIVVLEGWGKSRGASLETFVARLCGLPILSYPDLQPIDQRQLEALHGEACDVPVKGQDKEQPHGWGPFMSSLEEQVKNFPPLEPPSYHQAMGESAQEDEATKSPMTHMGNGWGLIRRAREEGGVRPGEPLLGLDLPEGEVRVVNEKTGGEKGSKPERYDLIPWEELDEVARLYARGALKYAEHNWTKGYDWQLSFNSLIRHAHAFWRGEGLDPETECSHMASVVFHALALMFFEKHHPDLDSRRVDAVRQ